MYVGDRDAGGMEHLLWEVVGNALDLYLARRASRIGVRITDDGWVEVEDDGPGFPPLRRRPDEPFVAELVLTTLHSGATFDGHRPHVHVTPSFWGAGLVCTNALSASLEIETRHDGRIWRQTYAAGRPTSAYEEVGRSERSGTRIRFLPDPEIFGDTRIHQDEVGLRLRELSYLNPSINIDYQGCSLAERVGVGGWAAERLAARGGPLFPMIVGGGRVADVEVDVAFGWSDDGGAAEIISFVNQVRTSRGGAHVRGFFRALRAQCETDNLWRVCKVAEPGLVLVLHASMTSPEFAGSTREMVRSPIAGKAVCAVVQDLLAHGSHQAISELLRRRLGRD